MTARPSTIRAARVLVFVLPHIVRAGLRLLVLAVFYVGAGLTVTTAPFKDFGDLTPTQQRSYRVSVEQADLGPRWHPLTVAPVAGTVLTWQDRGVHSGRVISVEGFTVTVTLGGGWTGRADWRVLGVLGH